MTFVKILNGVNREELQSKVDKWMEEVKPQILGISQSECGGLSPNCGDWWSITITIHWMIPLD
jgi:hypothetical protein